MDNYIRVNGNKNAINSTDVNKYIPLFKIKTTSPGVVFNGYRGMVFVRVFCLNVNDLKYKDYAIYVGTTSNIDLSKNYKFYDLNKEISYISCELDQNGDYGTFYVKNVSSNNHYSYQILYTPYPSWIEELSSNELVDISQIKTTPKFDYCTNRDVNWTELTLTSNGWVKQDAYNNRYEFFNGRFFFEIYASGGQMTDGVIIATVKQAPKRKVRTIANCYNEDGTLNSQCVVELDTDRNLKLYGCTDNTLLHFKLEYEISI